MSILARWFLRLLSWRVINELGPLQLFTWIQRELLHYFRIEQGHNDVREFYATDVVSRTRSRDPCLSVRCSRAVLRNPFPIQRDTLGSLRNMKHAEMGCVDRTRIPDIWGWLSFLENITTSTLNSFPSFIFVSHTHSLVVVILYYIITVFVAGLSLWR